MTSQRVAELSGFIVNLLPTSIDPGVNHEPGPEESSNGAPMTHTQKRVYQKGGALG